jgi:hypothetical protein
MTSEYILLKVEEYDEEKVAPEIDGRGNISLEWLQSQVGGYIEAIPGSHAHLLDDGRRVAVAWCDEEGLLRDREPNRMASEWFGQILVGDVLVEIVSE